VWRTEADRGVLGVASYLSQLKKYVDKKHFIGEELKRYSARRLLQVISGTTGWFPTWNFTMQSDEILHPG